MRRRIRAGSHHPFRHAAFGRDVRAGRSDRGIDAQARQTVPTILGAKAEHDRSFAAITACDFSQGRQVVLLDPIANELTGDRELNLLVIDAADAQGSEPSLELLTPDFGEQLK